GRNRVLPCQFLTPDHIRTASHPFPTGGGWSIVSKTSLITLYEAAKNRFGSGGVEIYRTRGSSLSNPS
ncbi:hypothetical protein PFISCL1PPCAC_20866, partial [Pristionchus fissidentatus]